VCGIFGVWHRDRAAIDPSALEQAARRLAHRGPDDSGYWLLDTHSRHAWSAGDADSRPELGLPALSAVGSAGADFALAHRRLSILDPSPAGHQPMQTPDGRHVIAFNGEIYNYLELRKELEAEGIRFRSTSDTEVLLHALAHWGARVLPRLVGMFAFAWIDVGKRELHLVRDFFGIKPLFYASSERGLAFASEVGPLLELPFVSRRADPQHCFDYVRFGLTDHDEGSLFADLHQLAPAHHLRIPLDGRTPDAPRRYWALDPEPQQGLTMAAAAARVRELFLENVALHLRSDVPVGAALSGGIDSSAIVACMRHLRGNALDLHGFSFIASDPEVSEEAWVDRVGEATAAQVHKVRLGEEDLRADLDRLITAQGEPFGSTSIHAQHRVFQLARERGVFVLLDGQGADELLGGYRSYLSARLATLLRRGRWVAAARFLRAAQALPGSEGARLLFRAGGVLLPARFKALARAAIGESVAPSWLDGQWCERHGVRLDPPGLGQGPDHLRGLLRETFFHTSLPGLLRYEDRNSMCFSVESRVPFLTPALVQFCLSLPEDQIISRQALTKAVFRRAMRGLVPDAILERRDKIGFQTPETRWLRSLRPWVEETLQGELASSIPLLRLQDVRSACAEALDGPSPFGFQVWRWLNLVRWSERFGVQFDA
jgi:asparagine synthase (glutamine-hydrolysing)